MTARFSQFKDIKLLAAELPQRRRTQLLLVLAIMLSGAFAEFVTLGAIVPFIHIMSDPAGFLQDRQGGLVGGLMSGQTEQQARLTLTLLFMGALLLAGTIRVLITWSTAKFAMRIGYDLTSTVYRNIIQQDYSFHLSNSSAELLGSLQKINVFAAGVVQPVMQAISAAITSVFIVAALVVINPVVATSAFLIILGLYLLIYLIVQPFQRQNGVVIAWSQSQRMRLVQEAFGGIRDIIINGLRGFYIGRFSGIENDLRNRMASNIVLSNVPKSIIETLLLAIASLAIYFHSSASGDFSSILPTAAAFALGMQRMLPYMQLAYRGRAQMTANAASTSDVRNFVSMKAPKPPADRWTDIAFDCDLRLEGVGFSYGTEGAPVLSDITFQIPKGAFVGITGQTGSGKSTLVDLIMGLQLPGSGTINVDGIALSRSNLGAWRSRIAHVSQSVFLVEGTIRENIALGVAQADIDEDRLEDVIRRAELTTVVADLADGLDTAVGERGARLSGGQRQRIGIARALYLNRDVVVLDEATSALDNATQTKVMANIRSMDQHVTILSITHRLDTLQGCDFIIHLEKGRLASTTAPDAPAPLS